MSLLEALKTGGFFFLVIIYFFVGVYMLWDKLFYGSLYIGDSFFVWLLRNFVLLVIVKASCRLAVPVDRLVSIGGRRAYEI